MHWLYLIGAGSSVISKVIQVLQKEQLAGMSEHFNCCPSIYEHTPYSSLTHRNAFLSTLPRILHSPPPNHPAPLLRKPLLLHSMI